MVFSSISTWHFLCLPLHRLDKWNVLYDISSFSSTAYCFLIRPPPSQPPFLQPRWSLRVETCCQPMETWHLGLSTALPLISMHESGSGAIFGTLESIPAAAGHWAVPIEVGEHGFGSLSQPTWWMACLTLSEQDGHCAGWGPQIVTADGFIGGWRTELSSSQTRVPRPPLSCMSHRGGKKPNTKSQPCCVYTEFSGICTVPIY